MSYLHERMAESISNTKEPSLVQEAFCRDGDEREGICRSCSICFILAARQYCAAGRQIAPFCLFDITFKSTRFVSGCMPKLLNV